MSYFREKRIGGPKQYIIHVLHNEICLLNGFLKIHRIIDKHVSKSLCKDELKVQAV